ncbi:DUF2909 family protein [Marinobacter hydrocarbonoclasticus]|nr:DUF2909 family protein [Marinobacter nauticus]
MQLPHSQLDQNPDGQHSEYQSQPDRRTRGAAHTNLSSTRKGASVITAFKSLIVLLLLFILFSLARAGLAMIRGGERSMTQHLGRRVALSALVLLVLVVALAAGWVPVNPRPY